MSSSPLSITFQGINLTIAQSQVPVNNFGINIPCAPIRPILFGTNSISTPFHEAICLMRHIPIKGFFCQLPALFYYMEVNLKVTYMHTVLCLTLVYDLDMGLFILPLVFCHMECHHQCLIRCFLWARLHLRHCLRFL